MSSCCCCSSQSWVATWYSAPPRAPSRVPPRDRMAPASGHHYPNGAGAETRGGNQVIRSVKRLGPRGSRDASRRNPMSGTGESGFSAPVLATPERPHAFRRGVVPRERLASRLQHDGAPIAALVAPAGYGKTTVLSEWDQDPSAGDLPQAERRLPRGGGRVRARCRPPRWTRGPVGALSDLSAGAELTAAWAI
jgi:hypothetical protein